MSTPPPEERYTRRWECCARCGTRRPMRSLGTESVQGTLRHVCLDSSWCHRVIADRARRELLISEGRECLAVADCADPREPGTTTCPRHRPPDPEQIPAPSAREPSRLEENPRDPRQQALPFDDD